MSERKYTLAEQREALEWLIAKTVPPLQVLAMRGEMPAADLEKYLPAIERIRATLTYIEEPWAQELLKRGRPK